MTGTGNFGFIIVHLKLVLIINITPPGINQLLSNLHYYELPYDSKINSCALTITWYVSS